MRAFIGWVSITLILLVAACSSRGKAVPSMSSPPMKPKATSLPGIGESVALEAEYFELGEMRVHALASASGGKVIGFTLGGGEASTEVRLSKGTYEVMLFLQGVDEDHDAVYLTVADTQLRLFPDTHGEVVQAGNKDADPVLVDVGSDGVHSVRLSHAEDGVLVDRLVLKRVK